MNSFRQFIFLLNKLDKQASQQLFILLQPFNNFFVLLAHLGDMSVITSLILLAAVIGFYINKKIMIIAVASLLIVISQAILALLLKKLIKRQRPLYSMKLNSQFYSAIPADKYSFPSAHAMRLSAVTVIVLYTSGYLGFFCLILAAIICISRVSVGVHFIGDVVGGILLGAITTGLIILCR